MFRNFSSLYLYDLVSCSHESFSKLCIHLSRFPLFEESSTHKDKDNQRYRSPYVQIKFPVLGSTNHPFFSWKKEESHPFFRVCLLAMTFRGNLASCRTHFLGQKKRPLKRQTNRSSDKCCMKMVPLKQCWSNVGVKPMKVIRMMVEFIKQKGPGVKKGYCNPTSSHMKGCNPTTLSLCS